MGRSVDQTNQEVWILLFLWGPSWAYLLLTTNARRAYLFRVVAMIKGGNKVRLLCRKYLEDANGPSRRAAIELKRRVMGGGMRASRV